MAQATEPTMPAEETPEQQPAAPSDKDLKWRQFTRRNPRWRVFLVIGVLILLVAGFFLWRYLGSYESTDDAQVDGHLNQVSARVAGHVVKLMVDDNQYVQAGQPLLQIDPRDYEIAIARAKANYEDALAGAGAAQVNVPITQIGTSSQVISAQADVENARAGIAAAKQQAAASEAQVAQAEANNVRAQSDLARYTQLVQKQEISQQQYDQAVANAKAMTATVEAARAAARAAQQEIAQAQSKLAQAQAMLRSSRTSTQQVQVSQSKAKSASANVDRMKAELDQAELNLQYTTVASPVNGIVTGRTVEVGQNVQPGQELLRVINLDDIWVTANFKETQLAHMRVGQPVTIHVDATDKDYKGRVQSLAGASGAILSLLPPENATGNYVKVVQRIPIKITFDPDETKGHELRPGMSVVPKVWIR